MDPLVSTKPLVDRLVDPLSSRYEVSTEDTPYQIGWSRVSILPRRGLLRRLVILLITILLYSYVLRYPLLLEVIPSFLIESYPPT